MRRIAIINQKGGVGKTTTTANLGAALAEQGRRVVLVDMDAQANLSLSLGIETESGSPTSYSVLVGESSFAQALRPTTMERVSLVASHIDLSGAELELAGQIGREFLLRDALKTWEDEERARTGRAPADYVLFDCPPSLGLLSINALATAGEVLITLQTEFLALQGMSKLVEVVQLLRKRLNPELTITGILPCLYESRLKLAREVLGEIRRYFPGQVFPIPIRANVKLAEAPSYGQTIFQYAPDSIGAMDYRCAAREVLRAEARDRDTATLPPFREDVLKGTSYQELVSKALEPMVTPKTAPEPLVTPATKAAATPIDTKASVVRETASTPARAAKPTPVASAAKNEVAPSSSQPSAKPVVARASEPALAPAVAPTIAAAADAKPARKPVAAPAPIAKTAAKPSTSAKSSSATKERDAKSSSTPAAATTQPSNAARDTKPTPSSASSIASTATPVKSPVVVPPPAKKKPTERAKDVAPAVVTTTPEKAPARSRSKPSTPKDAPPTAPTPKIEPRMQPAPRETTPSSNEKARKPSTPLAPQTISAPAAQPVASIPAANTIVPQPKPASRKTPNAPRATEKELTPHRARSLPRVAARESSLGPKPAAPKSAPPKPVAPKPRAAEAQPIVRADDLPPLPPDAFEILSGSGMDP